MKITHASRHRWWKKIKSDPLVAYGSSDQKRLKKTRAWQEAGNITYSIAPAADDFFSWFVPLYSESLNNKNSNMIHDVRAHTVDKPDTKLQYHTLTVRQNGTPIGGCIFSERSDHFSIAYRMFRPTWDNAPSRIASPALFGELLMDEYTKTVQKDYLVHGRDRNPYGPNSAIGVATFKLAVGCVPRMPNEVILTETDTNACEQDTLIMLPAADGVTITEAVLMCKDVTKYTQLLSYPDRLHVTVITQA